MLCIFCQNFQKVNRDGSDDLLALFLLTETSERDANPRVRSLRGWPKDNECNWTTSHLNRILCFSKETCRHSIEFGPHHKTCEVEGHYPHFITGETEA